MKKQTTYKDAGVDIEKAQTSLKRLKDHIAGTNTKEVLSGIGLFGGFYEFPKADYQRPVLVSSTDGVGTKLKIAFLMGKHDTVGQDLVNHCINDIACSGARPLFFLDYFASGKLNPGVYESVIKGMTIACKNAAIPLIGGETAEMPDFYHENEYDINGTIVGVVDKAKIIDGSKIEAGDVLIGVSSNGLHTNGFNLARKTLLREYVLNSIIARLNCSLGEELLKIHSNYYPLIEKIVNHFDVHGIAHITGGGIVKNTVRLLPENLDIKINWDNWDVPAVFTLIQETGKVPEDDMRQTFNMGIGLVFIISKNIASELQRWGNNNTDFKFSQIGEVN
jgi:phosphoribosylformylglycinamidine cyclo-ligase